MKKVSNGIDVSYHQGLIDWEKVKPHIGFAMIRAGYGMNTVDAKFERNASECERLNIPYGVYWFSYAKSAQQAAIEAQRCLAVIKGKKLSFPVVFDYEYDSDEKALKAGYLINNNDRYNIAKTFLEVIENAGYYAMLYANKDYMSKGFEKLCERYDLWLAQWTDDIEPYKNCGIWQWTSKGKVDGITGYVDLDISFKDYPSFVRKEHENTVVDKLKKLYQEFGEILKDL